jgi:hypothetical protein
MLASSFVPINLDFFLTPARLFPNKTGPIFAKSSFIRFDLFVVLTATRYAYLL